MTQHSLNETLQIWGSRFRRCSMKRLGVKKFGVAKRPRTGGVGGGAKTYLVSFTHVDFNPFHLRFLFVSFALVHFTHLPPNDALYIFALTPFPLSNAIVSVFLLCFPDPILSPPSNVTLPHGKWEKQRR